MNDLIRPAMYDAYHDIKPVAPRPGALCAPAAHAEREVSDAVALLSLSARTDHPSSRT
jgi:diaminopimelate decarboxylase